MWPHYAGFHHGRLPLDHPFGHLLTSKLGRLYHQPVKGCNVDWSSHQITWRVFQESNEFLDALWTVHIPKILPWHATTFLPRLHRQAFVGTLYKASDSSWLALFGSKGTTLNAMEVIWRCGHFGGTHGWRWSPSYSWGHTVLKWWAPLHHVFIDHTGCQSAGLARGTSSSYVPCSFRTNGKHWACLGFVSQGPPCLQWRLGKSF